MISFVFFPSSHLAYDFNCSIQTMFTAINSLITICLPKTHQKYTKQSSIAHNTILCMICELNAIRHAFTFTAYIFELTIIDEPKIVMVDLMVYYINLWAYFGPTSRAFCLCQSLKCVIEWQIVCFILHLSTSRFWVSSSAFTYRTFTYLSVIGTFRTRPWMAFAMLLDISNMFFMYHVPINTDRW